MRQRSDREAIDASLGDLADVVEGDPAGSFEFNGWCSGVADAHGLAKLIGGHVVKEDNIGIFGQDLT